MQSPGGKIFRNVTGLGFNNIITRSDKPWQEAMTKLGLEQFMDYNLAWADFTASRNWGMREDGTAVLVDEGAIDDLYLQRGYDADGQYQADWDRILKRRKQLRHKRQLGRNLDMYPTPDIY